ncbi:8647_t:CDS:2 [Acaulospora morrowiae]|uniref:8647_t:CDS:1 n=1 Tax=Acaulospora morrowiae TaxID=94023 RepID=A0A9N8VDZ3_9GLOM|nr:8647_t:CDS:2 [Acaulospora morrowiae]
MESSVMTPEDNLNGIIPGYQRPAEICVDYLSHEWKKEDDIWTSWKAMSKQKKDIDNGVRLENASWRSWAKQKYKLKTVKPELLNWHKDSDVTWLYGPLHTAWLPPKKDGPKLSTTMGELNLNSSCHKSCLKKKSITEILNPSVKSKYPSLVSSNSDTQLYKKNRGDDDVSDSDSASTCSISGPTTPISGPTKSILLPTDHDSQSQPRHHIRFNDQVEQCIAVDSADEDDDHINALDLDSSSSDDDGLEMKISRKKKKDCTTIFKLAPTKLKYDRLYNNEYSALYTKQSHRRKSSNSNSVSSTPPATTSANISLFDFDKPSPIIRHAAALYDPIHQEQGHESAGDQGDAQRSLFSVESGLPPHAVHFPRLILSYPGRPETSRDPFGKKRNTQSMSKWGACVVSSTFLFFYAPTAFNGDTTFTRSTLIQTRVYGNVEVILASYITVKLVHINLPICHNEQMKVHKRPPRFGTLPFKGEKDGGVVLADEILRDDRRGTRGSNVSVVQLTGYETAEGRHFDYARKICRALGEKFDNDI